MTQANITREQAEAVARNKWNEMAESERDAYGNSSINGSAQPVVKYAKTSQKVVEETKGPQYEAIKPKKVKTAWMCFVNQRAPEIVKEQEITYSEAFKKCGEIWKTISDEDKQPFLKEATEDQDRFNK